MRRKAPDSEIEEWYRVVEIDTEHELKIHRGAYDKKNALKFANEYNKTRKKVIDPYQKVLSPSGKCISKVKGVGIPLHQH